MNDFVGWLCTMAVQENAVVIAPHKQPFEPKQRQFLDGIRTVPARILAMPGQNPYSAAIGKPGQWVFIWVPDKE